MKELRIGLIGCGKVGEFHATALGRIAGCRLTAACNRSPGRLAAFCAKYRLRGYQDVGAMLAQEHLDAVTICTPHPSHAALALQCAAAGCHVMIEKPLAVTVAECDAIIAAGERHHVLIGTLVQRRNYLPCRRIRAAIDAGKIGRPILGEAVMLGWRSPEYYRSDPWRGTWAGEGGGALLTQASHQIDLLNWYLGEPDVVYGQWANYNHPGIEVEDSAAAVIRYRSGAMATLLASNSQNPALYGRVHVFGDNGAAVGVQTDGGQMFIAGVTTIAEPPVTDLWTVPGETGRLEGYVREDRDFFAGVDQMIYFHQLHLENFIKAVRGEAPLLADARAGRATVAVCAGVYAVTRDPERVWHCGPDRAVTPRIGV